MTSYTKSRIAADPHTPWIGVHSLTEFMFCPRAGLLAHESGDHERPEEQPNLRYLPEWSLEAIQQRLRVVGIFYASMCAPRFVCACMNAVFVLRMLAPCLSVARARMLVRHSYMDACAFLNVPFIHIRYVCNAGVSHNQMRLALYCMHMYTYDR